MASLTVERGVSAVGESTVYWEVSSNGLQDLEPVSGNLTFQEVLYYVLILKVAYIPYNFRPDHNYISTQIK